MPLRLTSVDNMFRQRARRQRARSELREFGCDCAQGDQLQRVRKNRKTHPPSSEFESRRISTAGKGMAFVKSRDWYPRRSDRGGQSLTGTRNASLVALKQDIVLRS